MLLEDMKLGKYLKLIFKKKYQSKLRKIIYKAYIIIVSPNRTRSWPPYIKEHKIKGNLDELNNLGKGN
jgi:hypothetical protein